MSKQQPLETNNNRTNQKLADLRQQLQAEEEIINQHTIKKNEILLEIRRLEAKHKH